MRPFPYLLMIGLLIMSCSQEKSGLTIVSGDAESTIFSGNTPLLSYVHEETLPPEGIDPVYKRSAYIHPLRSPGGEILTRIQPPDHYHHYGIWNPWTRTIFGERKVDFWNLAEGQGTVRFAEYLEKVEKEQYAGFTVRQEHIYFLEDGSEGVALNETWDVKIQNMEENFYVLDLSTTLNCPIEKGMVLEAYRYGGGIGFRATEKWHKENCTVQTSEGNTREDADGTGARWCIVEGESSVQQGRSGILFLSHPSNRGFPEPMRVWPLDANGGRGDMFFEFCPIRHHEWKLEQGQDYTLKYRLVVFDGKMDVASAEKYWKNFAN